jgi:hypothetical protein
MNLGGNWVNTKSQRLEAAVRSLPTMTIAADNLNAIGLSRGALIRTIAKAVLC